MNYQAAYDYINDITQNLGLSVKFFHGRKEWLNYTVADDPLYAYMLPLTSSGSMNESGNPQEIWQLNLIFYQKDAADSALDQNDENEMQDEMKTLSITSQAADKFLRLFEFNDITDDLESASDLISVRSFTKGNAIKDNALLLTGTVLTINFLVADDFDYCC